MKYSVWMLIAAGTLAGCGSATATPASEPAVEPAPESQSSAMQSDMSWEDLDFNGKQAFMAGVVIPEMKPLFVEHHPDFACQTCHGSTAPDVNFKMPNTLDPLDPGNMPFNSTDEKVLATAAFMKDTVVPKMAGLLKEAPYDPATGEGFGCFNCHAKK
jgi:hypothetical protein